MKMHWKMVIALVLGVTLGILFGGWYGVWESVVNGIGQIFLRAIGMIVVPLVFLSTVLGISNMNGTKSNKNMVVKTFVFFFVSSIIAAVVGIVLTNVIKPGIGGVIEVDIEDPIESINAELADEITWMDRIVDFVPKNIFAAFSNGDMLPIILFSLLFGFFVTKLSNDKRITINGLFDACKDVTIKIANFVINFMPLGVFAIIMNEVGKYANNIWGFFETMRNIVSFVGVVWIALVLMGVIVLPMMLIFIAKVSPINHLAKIKNGLILAFLTSSSYICMPDLIKDTNNMGVSNKVASFIIPLGITFNKVGTIIYECVAVIFVAQVAGANLNVIQQILLICASIVTVLGAPSVPMAGVFVLAILLKTMGLPDNLVGMLMAVDILCDMPKTLLNAYSVGCGAVIVAKSEGEVLCV